MLRTKVRSLVDTHLNTGISEYNISAGQVFTCDLKDQEVLDGLVEIKILEVINPTAPEVKPIPVFYPATKQPKAILLDEHGQLLPLSGGLDNELEQDV